MRHSDAASDVALKLTREEADIVEVALVMCRDAGFPDSEYETEIADRVAKRVAELLR